MGAADVVPGVSGGTIAFISGIYEELLSTIKGFNFSAFKFLKENGIKATWEHLNLSFLAALLLGIGTSVVTLAGAISSILEEEGETSAKIGLWSFFFGLIIASVIYIGKQIRVWNASTIVGLICGAAIAYYITIAPIGGEHNSVWYIFFAGSIAICAMILPGISGSFILVLMGAYQPVMGAITGLSEGLKEGNSVVLMESGVLVAAFLVGTVLGLLSFSRVLSWLFKHKEQLTLAVLTGFMIGSLNKIWPWKKVISSRINSHGEEVPLQYGNMIPSDYESLFNVDPNVGLAIGLAILGFAIVFGLEFLGKKFEKQEA